MTLNSFSFIIFLFVVSIAYFTVPKKYQWVVLLISSYLFYYFASGQIAVYLLITTGVVFYAGIKIDRINIEESDYFKENKARLKRAERKEIKLKYKKQKRVYLITALIICLGLLGFFKYYNFIAGNVNAVLGLFSLNFDVPLLNIILPLGISFYTFQSLSYITDIYRGKYSAQKNIFKFALFTGYFPQIMQGPIGRYNELFHQFFEEHKFEYTRVVFGIERIMWGFFKKLVIADRIAPIVSGSYANYSEYTGVQLFIVALLYSIQIYTDFSGYMDIAAGASQVLGINLAENFNRPYFAKSISEYWQRWHMTLSGWFRDYMFYPLSISKTATNIGKWGRKHFGIRTAKLLPAYFGMIIVWFTTGLWHGADWKFIAWGFFNGLFMIMAMQFEGVFDWIKEKLKIENQEAFFYRAFRVIKTFFIITLLKVFTISGDISQAFGIYKKIFTGIAVNHFSLNGFIPLIEYKDFQILLVSVLLLFIVSLIQRKGSVRERIAKLPTALRIGIFIILLFAIMIFGIYIEGGDGGGFIYEQF